jgi:hypothetical protein
MPDYQRGKIYKITSGDLTYVGSTTEKTLARRLSSHVKDYKRWKAGKRENITSFQVIDKGDYEITLLELCPCNSRDELTARERYWVETIKCVNRCIPGRTRKEYREDHKEFVAEIQKTWQQKNQDHIKQYRQDHKEEHNEHSKSYYYRNREKVLARLKEKYANKT